MVAGQIVDLLYFVLGVFDSLCSHLKEGIRLDEELVLKTSNR